MRFVNPRLVIILGLLGLLSACADNSQPARDSMNAAVGAAADSIPLLDGTTLSLSELEGRWVFVNYWAEWCAPCREEIPELNALQAEAGDRVLVLGINFDQLPVEVMGPQAEKLGIRFAVAAEDPRDLLGITLPEVLPSTYVFDPQGNQAGVLLGPQDLDQLRAAMQEG
ncbi:MAG: TlpA family protein disulfide reductase [Gammaproteobacteria bacterium]|nr:TlpA family protein disulfide reductase [Gammaproteobacteria bacterium]